VSVVVPLLKRLTASKLLFYGHYPDMLLAERASPLRRLYRAPLDWLEGASTAVADRVLVNSRFTRDVYVRTFPQLAAAGHDAPQVLYPAARILSDEELQKDAELWETGEGARGAGGARIGSGERARSAEHALWCTPVGCKCAKPSAPHCFVAVACTRLTEPARSTK